jgi:hypothetical protein
MKKDTAGFIRILFIVMLGVMALYYFKVDVQGIFLAVINKGKMYAKDADTYLMSEKSKEKNQTTTTESMGENTTK